MDYKDTVNLPRTDFPMRANLAEREPAMLARWRALDLYRRLQEATAGRPRFVLHDGPPYANGHIHIGHVLNKVLKDIIVKYRAMSGRSAPYVPGWDCHGLPIELEVERALGRAQKDAMPVAAVRARCREYAARFVAVQRAEFERLGVLGDWDRPYLTMDPAYEADEVRALGRCFAAGLVYRGKKPVHWCPSCRTALAEAEVEYEEEETTAVYVAYPVATPLPPLLTGLDAPAAAIWTTTPWTLPASLAIAVHPEHEYVAVRMGPRTRLVAAGPQCAMLAREVGLDADPAVLCARRGRFTDEVPEWAGVDVFAANPRIVALLKARGRLLAEEVVVHSYPHCWRCKSAIVFRATEQWFLGMDRDGLRARALAEIDRVRWIPAWGRERIHGMVATRPDWCISRQRAWGVPVVALYCEGCGGVLADAALCEHAATLFEREGADAWFTRPVTDLIPPGTRCPGCGGTAFRRETDILDVWFDSGVSWLAVVARRPELGGRADLYLEGSDQHRGWFHSALLTAVALTGRAPYASVLTHGFTVDGMGRKMSKSVGNVVAPEAVVARHGAELLRLWVAAADYREDVRISDEILGQLVEAYRRLRNTARFLLANLYDFDPGRDAVALERLPPLERWVLDRTAALAERVQAAYEQYEFHVVTHALTDFCAVELSSFYLDVRKDRLYCERRDSVERRATQTAFAAVLDVLVRLMAPVLSFTADELWQHLPAARETPSVFLAGMPAVPAAWRDAGLAARFERLLAVRAAVTKALEAARQGGVVRQGTEARIVLDASGEVAALLAAERALVPGLLVAVERAAGGKCARCGTVRPLGLRAAHPALCARCADVLA